MIGNSYEQSKNDGIMVILLSMASISILISANLGVMNLLPIPALDGGRLVFLIIEAVRGKPVDPDKEGKEGQILCYIHDPDEVIYAAAGLSEFVDEILLTID